MKKIRGSFDSYVFTDSEVLKSGVYFSTLFNFLDKYTHFDYALWNGAIYRVAHIVDGCHIIPDELYTEFSLDDLVDC